MEIVMFYIFAAMIVAFSILTVTSRRILRAAVFLLFVLIATAGIYFWLDNLFLAAVQLTVYAGGIVVLIIFSILLTSQINNLFPKVELKKALATAILTAVGAGLSIFTLIQYPFQATTEKAIDLNMNFLGKSLLNYGENGFVLPFEVISITLLASMFGAIVIAKGRKNIKNEESV